MLGDTDPVSQLLVSDRISRARNVCHAVVVEHVRAIE